MRRDLLFRPIILNSEQAYSIFLSAWDSRELDFIEQSMLMLLDANYRDLDCCLLATGTPDHTDIEPRICCAAAMKANASAIMVAHNYPTQVTTPSKSDDSMIARLDELGNLMAIRLLDSLIISRSGYFSDINNGSSYSKYHQPPVF